MTDDQLRHATQLALAVGTAFRESLVVKALADITLVLVDEVKRLRAQKPSAVVKGPPRIRRT
jgi:hypothetical protein